MSCYEKYDSALAAVYGVARQAVGVEIIAKSLHRIPTPLPELAVLDAGCGTGSYAVALANRVGRLVALDHSKDMLAIAQSNAREKGVSITFAQGSVRALPFVDGSFDAVILSQVLHHLERGDDPEFGGHSHALGEAYRVLRPKGLVILSVCEHAQLLNSFWYYDLIPDALDEVLRRCAPRERLERILSDVGFQLLGRFVPLDGVMQGDAYFDQEGPLKPDWRRLDSIWALVTSEELAKAESQVCDLKKRGTLVEYVASRDAGRSQFGQFTFYVAMRSGERG